ncbi:MAG: VOC family protein [Planctomycetes bacterium]|nr:VOC family protein [Planctomycetota bacterium]
MRLTHVTLVIEDLERSVAFYESVLGAVVQRRTTHAELRLGDCRLALCTRQVLDAFVGVPMPPPDGKTVGGVVSIALVSEVELNQIIDRAKGCGGRVLKHPFTPEWGGRSAWIGDPDGHWVEFTVRK